MFSHSHASGGNLVFAGFPLSTKRIRMQECCGASETRPCLSDCWQDTRQCLRLGSNILLFCHMTSLSQAPCKVSSLFSQDPRAIQQATASQASDAPGYSPSQSNWSLVHIEKLAELRSQGPVQESGKNSMSLHLRVEFLGCVSHTPSWILRTITHRGSGHALPRDLQVLHLTINMRTCRSSPRNSGPPSWAQSRDYHRLCSLRNGTLGGCSTQVQAAVPWPLYTLASLRSCLSPTCQSQSLVPPGHSAPSLDTRAYLEGRAGSLGCISGPPAAYKDAHSGKLLPLGSGRLPRNDAIIQSYTFLSEHKGFFVTHIPESVSFLLSPRDLNLNTLKLFPGTIFCLLFSPILLFSLLPPSKADLPLSLTFSQSYLCFTGFCAFRVGRDGENHCLIKRWGEMRWPSL